MKSSKALKIYLILSGLLLTFIGGATLVNPVEMKGSAGIEIAGNISVINDVRAFSALLLALAITVIFGAFKSYMRHTSTLLATLVFLSLGIGRLVSILLDGMPVDGLVKATGLELILGVIGILLLVTKTKSVQPY